YQRHAKKLEAERQTLDERQELRRVQETALQEEIIRCNTERELTARRLQDERAALNKDQHAWRRRRSLEMMALKTKERAADDAQLKLKQARQLLIAAKDASNQQLDALQKELHGL